MLMMGRNRLLIGAAVALLTAGAWLYYSRGLTGSGSSPIASGPIVFISIDTLRADRLPAYGSTRTTTPNIDRLAADGVLFENAYAHSPQTLPSHASILSGELPFEHGVRDNVGFEVKPGQRFLQHRLKDAGFVTGGFVSAYVLREQVGFNQGFDTFDDELPAASPEAPLGQVQRDGEQTMAKAMAWMAPRKGAPHTEGAPQTERAPDKFFLFTHIYEPHTPYTPPARFASADPYDGEVAHADEIVGKLLDHLRAEGLYDRATIVLFSDHGEGLGDHGEEEHGIFLYRETIQVPLIIKLPDSAGGGRRIAAPVQHIDLVPTILDLAGLQADGMRGRSLVPVLTGTGPLPPANIYAESLSPRYHFGWSELYALSDDRYRLVRAPKDELYDLAQDPEEQNSIAAERPQVRSAMRAALDGMIAGAGVTAPSAVSDEDRQKLAALGYVGTQSGSALQLPGDQLPDPKDKVETLQAYRRAVRLAGEQQHGEAAALFRRLVESDPGMTDVWLRLAEAENRLGRSSAALAAYGEVISRDPRNPAALTGATATLLRAGRIDEAKAHAELAVDVAPAIAHETLARIAVHQRDEAAARRHAQLAHKADPTLPLIPFVEGMILHTRGDFRAAAGQLLAAKQAMAGRTEQLADLNYLAGDALARLERYPEAEQLFRAELAFFPAHVPSYTGLAMLYRATGRDAEAERAIANLLRASPTPQAIEAAAQLWTMFGEPGKAAALRARLGPGPG